MASYLIRRLGQAVFVLLLVSLLVFMGVYAIGDPVQMLVPPDASPAEIARARQNLGLDQPIFVQYLVYLQGLMQGDLGTSFVYNQPTIDLVLQRLPATVELGLTAFVFSLIIGLPLGLIAGYRAGSRTDDGIMNGSILAYSLPNFWQGLLLILLFAVQLRWFPSGGRGETVELFGIRTSLLTADGWRHVFLPAMNLALFNAAMVTRLTRAQVQQAMNSEYVRYARAKGVAERRILIRHAFRNVLIPLVTVLGMELGNLLAYGIITETVFNWPGMGQLLIHSINVVDRPVIVGYLLIVVAMFVVINLVVDVLYTILDPRIQLGGRKA
ncbi:ABC transporter permease [Paracoccus sp. p4-l81]|uniref:ABC transporter permease n=1 Tax=Paracoccus sp. p4-l81 TaxID=3342806 RepID=UPI0035B9A2DA